MRYTMNTQLKKTGNDTIVELSKEVLDITGFKDTENIKIIAETDQILIKSFSDKQSLEELFANYHNFYEPSEEDIFWLNMSRPKF